MLKSLPRQLRLGVALLLPVFATARAGMSGLDATFGNGGKVTTAVGVAGGGTFGTIASSVVIQSDDKVVVAGSAFDGSSTHLVIVRYASDGTLDLAFNGTGVVTGGLSANSVESSLAVQSDGKLLLTGLSGGNGVVTRYNADGSVDTSFNSTGQVSTGCYSSHLALQSDDKIVVLGYPSGSDAFELLRYQGDGSLDPAFGSAGQVITDFGSGSGAAPTNLIVQPDGNILVIGYRGTYPDLNALLVRYLPDGTLDSSFGTAGIVTTDFGNGVDLPGGVALQPDGKIVVAGIFSKAVSGSSEAVVRYTANGTRDTTFHKTGVAPLPLSIYGDAVVAVQGDGRILVIGAVSKSTIDTADFAIARFLADGTADAGFGSKGTLAVDFGGGEVGLGLAVQSDGKIIAAGNSVAADGSGNASGAFTVARLLPGAVAPLDPPVDPPVYDTTLATAQGAAFLAFGAPAVDGGVVGGAASVKTGKAPKRTVIYGGASGDELTTTGAPDGAGATFTVLGDPIFAGEALGFAATVEVAPQSGLLLHPMEFDLRAFVAKPGGRLSALYSQLSRAAGIHRLAAQTDNAPGGGQYAKFGSFGLPRDRVGLLYAALLHHDANVTTKNDSGIWRERADGSGTDLLLRTGQRGFSRTRGAGGRGLEKLTFMPPVPNATDQRLSHSPDGGLAALAQFDDGTSGVVAVAADGTPTVPLDTTSAVPDEAGTADGSVEFVKFLPPATASTGRLALLAALKAAQAGAPPPPAQAIISNLGGRMQRVLARGDVVPGLNGPRFGQLGQPLLGEKGLIGLIAALTGQGVKPTTNKVLLQIDGGTKTVIARLGDPVPDYGPGVVFKKFMSLVVTDSDPARMVFTALVGGPGVNGGNNVGVWSHSAAGGTKLVLRSGGTIKASGQTLTIRTFEALVAPKKSQGQGRSTDASGFVTAKAKLSDGRVGVLRIPLP